jgi:hypothetical protein
MEDHVYRELNRPVPSWLGVPSIIGATPFINRYFALEWVAFTQVKPEDYIQPAYNVLDQSTAFSIEPHFALQLSGALAHVIRTANALTNKTSVMVEFVNGFTFNERYRPSRVDQIGELPDNLPSANLDRERVDLLTGIYSRDEAIARIKAAQQIGIKVLIYINRAFVRFYPSGDWNFHAVLAPAGNYCVNATIPGAAIVITNATWSHLSKPENSFLSNPESIILSNRIEDSPAPTVAPLLTITQGNPIVMTTTDSELSSQDDVRRISPPPRVPAPTPERPSPHYSPYPSESGEDQATANITRILENVFKDEDDFMPLATFNHTAPPAALNEIDPNIDHTMSELPTLHVVQSNLAHADVDYQYVPHYKDKPFANDCPCGLKYLLQRAFDLGANEQLNKIRDQFAGLQYNQEASTSSAVTRMKGKEKETGKLIVHPIYGSNAQNALIPVRYTPYASKFRTSG